MNISIGDDLHVSGFNRELRSDLDDALSVAKSFTSMSIASSNHSLLHGKSDGSVSPPEPAAAPRVNGPIEVDFYRNPTVLSRMILYNKFANANKRCRDHPQEAHVWVCAKRKAKVTQVSPFLRGMLDDRSRSNRSTRTAQQHQQQQQSQSDENQQYSLRQLPIHIACTSLAFAHDASSRSELEQLIVRLVVTYPEGCAEFDHGGKLPLHEAIWSNASSETIAMLLMASPRSIERRDKFGRAPMELNNRRSGNDKGEIQDMLLLGVKYWEEARQEAKLRMKMAMAPLPSGDKSIDSTSVLGSSHLEKDTIYTSDSVALPPRKEPHPVQIESEEIVPMAWEQLERRVLLLEQLLAEMYEKNFELSGLVEELKRTKTALSAELEAARAMLQPQSPLTSKSSSRSKRASFASLGSSPSVAVVPEDDEMSSVKLMEHADRIEQLESLVGSYHSSRRKRLHTGGGSSRQSELSSMSSQTGNGAYVRAGMARNETDSLISGLTEEASYFNASIHAVKETLRREDLAADDDTELSGVPKAAELHGSSNTFSGWTPPVAATSFLNTTDIRPDLPAAMAVEEEEGEESADMSTGFREESRAPATPANASEIYFPGFGLDPSTAHVNSTISLSASSAVSSESFSAEMDSTIVSEEKEIYFSIERDSLGTFDDNLEEEQVSSATRSTRARLEDLVFGSGPDGHEQSKAAHHPQRYNYDIRIPALDTYYPSSDTGEI